MSRVAFTLGLIAWGVVCSVALAASDAPMLFRLEPAESRVWFNADARLHSFRGATQQLTGVSHCNSLSTPNSPTPP